MNIFWVDLRPGIKQDRSYFCGLRLRCEMKRRPTVLVRQVHVCATPEESRNPFLISVPGSVVELGPAEFVEPGLEWPHIKAGRSLRIRPIAALAVNGQLSSAAGKMAASLNWFRIAGPPLQGISRKIDVTPGAWC